MRNLRQAVPKMWHLRQYDARNQEGWYVNQGRLLWRKCSQALFKL